jgi:hypothetical protein
MKDPVFERARRGEFWIPIVAFVIVLTLWILNAVILVGVEGHGQYGDMFGAVNALFSGLAFAGVVYAIILQRAELAIARDDLNKTKRIMDDQQNSIAAQNSHTEKKSFEDTFFQMIGLFDRVVSQIDLRDSQAQAYVTAQGRDTFSIFVTRLERIFDKERAASSRQSLLLAYEKFYQKENKELGHYFRLLYNIMKFIDKSSVEDKVFYANVLRAMLSDKEVALLFYNGLSPHGHEFKPLIEKYRLLKHLKREDIFEESFFELYDPATFHDR